MNGTAALDIFLTTSAFPIQWIGLTVAVAFIAVSLLAPGYLLARAAGARRLAAAPIAPALTLIVLEVLASVLYRAGVRASWTTLVALPTLAAAILAVVSRAAQPLPPHPAIAPAARVDGALMALYCLAGIAAVCFVFLANLDGPSSFQPDNDNATHLGIIRAFADAGSYSSLAASSYLSATASPMVVPASFYPAAFHILPALAVSQLGCSAPLAENAMITVVIGIVLPLGWCSLVSTASRGNRRMIACGALFCLSTTAFPWRLIGWGPLLPNMLALALIPVSIASFMDLVRSPRPVAALRFASCLVAVAIAHPSGAFTLGVLLVPYMAHVLWDLPVRPAARTGSPALWGAARRLARVAALLAVVAIVWWWCFNLPFLQSTVQFTWLAFQSIPQSAASVAGMSFGRPYPQLLVPVLMVAGIAYTLRRREFLWVSAAFFFTAVQWAVSASSDGFSDQLLNGFWYTDYNRLAANAALIGTFLVILGVYALSRALSLLARRIAPSGSVPARAVEGVLGCALAAWAVVLVFTPKIVPWDVHSDNTAAGDVQVMVNEKYRASMPHGYDAAERAFVEEVKRVIPKGALVLNVPNDGSCFSYAVDGLNVYYRTVSLYKWVNDGESLDSSTVRRGLFQIASRDDVKRAASDIGARYVLLLDQGAPDPGDQDRFIPVFNRGIWQGIDQIGDDTPGFRVALAQGDMRLYEIID